MKRNEVTRGLRYFFKKLEKRSDELAEQALLESEKHQEVPFDEVEHFIRSLMTQNIFIHTVGVNGKHESLLLGKAMFNINRVVRIHYSTSFDEANQGYLRVRPDKDEQLIVVERLHGNRPKPELLYASVNECHVMRFLTNWLLRRIDWSKTKIENLDMYRVIREIEQKEYEEKIAAELEEMQSKEIQEMLDKHFSSDR